MELPPAPILESEQGVSSRLKADPLGPSAGTRVGVGETAGRDCLAGFCAQCRSPPVRSAGAGEKRQECAECATSRQAGGERGGGICRPVDAPFSRLLSCAQPETRLRELSGVTRPPFPSPPRPARGCHPVWSPGAEWSPTTPKVGKVVRAVERRLQHYLRAPPTGHPFRPHLPSKLASLMPDVFGAAVADTRLRCSLRAEGPPAEEGGAPGGGPPPSRVAPPLRAGGWGARASVAVPGLGGPPRRLRAGASRQSLR